MEADRVVGEDHAAEERDEQADLGPAVEARVAREGPRDPAHVERAQVVVGVVVGPHQHREVAIGPAALVLLPDQLGHLVGLGGDGVERQVPRRLPLPDGGDEPLVDLLGHLEAVGVVVLDEPVGRVQHRLGRAAVLLQHDLARVRIGPVEVEDVAHGRAAEAEDGLVVVAHHRHVAMTVRQQLDQLELRVVGVLELVHQDVPVPALVAPQDVRARPEETQRLHDLVAEVDLPEPGHQRLVLRVGPRELEVLLGGEARLVVGRGGQQLLGVRQVLVRAHVLVLQAAELGEDRVQVPRGVAERPVVLERELEEVVAQEDDLLGPGEHAEVRGEPQLERVLLDEAVAEGVERGDLHVGVAVGHEGVHALFHLGRGLVGEGQREDLGGARRAGRDEIGDAAGDDGGLAGARARDDQQRTGLVGDRRRLGRVQPFENPLGAPRSFRHQAKLYHPWSRSLYGTTRDRASGTHSKVTGSGPSSSPSTCTKRLASPCTTARRAFTYVTPGMPRCEPVKAAAR